MSDKSSAYQEGMQRAFNKSAQHLIKQNRQAAAALGCCYRTEDGLTCAIGCLIPDEKYELAMEGTSASSKGVFEAVAQEFFPAALADPDYHSATDASLFLVSLQAVHDRHAPQEWPYQLSRVALKYGLDPTASTWVGMSGQLKP